MDKLLLTLTLVAFSSGVLCNAEQNLTDTANSTLAPMGIMNNNENVYSASADLELMNQTSIRGNYPYRCCTGDMGVPTYKLHNRRRVWNEARASCISEGGDTLEAAGYDNWVTNEPNNWGGEKHCGGITRGSYVTNRQCDNLQSYFCKIYEC